MPSWSDLGHAMRRRTGAPSNHHESVGNSMSKKYLTPEEIIASAEHANSARRYVGLSVPTSVDTAKPLTGKLIPKKNTQAADPTAGGKANRTNVPAGDAAASERMGAKYRVTAKMPSVDPTSGPTLANARVVRSVAGRQSPNFNDGMQSVL